MSHLSRAPIDVASLVSRVTRPDRGGHAAFVGTVRNHQGGREVVGLEYSAYEPMADAVCAAIVAEAERRWPVEAALVHRVGALGIGDVAVAIVVGGGHRDEAFAACRFVIEEVKRRAPIWKRERYADGTEAWVNPTAPSGGYPAAVTDR